jgi:ABC-type glycerol-3-phosphate transport system substrate-binding protein
LVPNSRRGRRVQLVGGSHVSIPTASKNRDEAWRLAEHFVSNESTKTLFDGCGFFLATKPVFDNPDSIVDTKRYRGLDWHFSSIKQADEVRSDTACPIGTYLYEIWFQEWQAIITKQTTGENALSNLQRQLTERLAAILKA